MKLSLGFSPCPNDTFIFDALVNKKIDTEGLEFDVVLDDVAALNNMAFKQKLDISKISFNAYIYINNAYVLLESGAALGKNCGPILISKKKIDKISSSLNVGIPGKFTTANFLLSLAYPELKHKKEYIFSDIENQINKGNIDCGLIIHENRFTYAQRGFNKIIDLGEWWESKTNKVIPLGGIVIKRGINIELQKKVNRLLKKSIQFAFDNPKSSYEYVKSHAQEMDYYVMKKHIELYVNNYTLELGTDGKSAIEYMFKLAKKQNLIQTYESKLFVS